MCYDLSSRSCCGCSTAISTPLAVCGMCKAALEFLETVLMAACSAFESSTVNNVGPTRPKIVERWVLIIPNKKKGRDGFLVTKTLIAKRCFYVICEVHCSGYYQSHSLTTKQSGNFFSPVSQPTLFSRVPTFNELLFQMNYL